MLGRDPASGREGRLDPARVGALGNPSQVRIFLEDINIIASHTSTTFLAAQPSHCILCILHSDIQYAAKNYLPHLKTAGCPANTGLCATTSAIPHHTGSSLTCYPMVLRCCTSKGGRGSWEEGGCVWREERSRTIEGADREEGQRNCRIEGMLHSRMCICKRGANHSHDVTGQIPSTLR